ncbi:MAG: CotH kinase family protein [Ignavibacteriales bacterium]|nr:CotH kinase family protein [Ignavibacteriales bacterium]
MLQKLIIFLIYFCSNGFPQGIVINELMPSNISYMKDEDGDFCDWIELYNASGESKSLAGCFLSDDFSNLKKWSLPAISLFPKQFKVIYASGKDKRTFFHYETVADWGDEWKYFVGKTNPPTNWASFDFSDSDWLSGSSGFGYGDGDDSTNIGSTNIFQPSPVSCFIRKEFNVEDVTKITKAFLHIDYNDGFVAYLNDKEIARSNLGVTGIHPSYNEFAEQQHDALMFRGLQPEEFIINQIQPYLHDGKNVIAIEVHNESLYSTNLSLIPFFTLEMTESPLASLGQSGFLTFPDYTFHTNFKLKSGGESLYLSNSIGEIIDSVQFSNVPDNVSLGRKPYGGEGWLFFNEPTPGSENSTPGLELNNGEVNYSMMSGSYLSSFNLVLTSTNPGQKIYYTLDGSEPNDKSNLYQNPITVDSVTIVRASTIDDGLLPGKISTQTYFVNKNFELPVISFVTDPENLWSEQKGIYILGPNADMSDYPYWGANFWQDWERPVNIEYFDKSGISKFHFDGTTKIYGSWSRLYPEKSFAIYTGKETINYQIFPDKKITDFHNIVLRNAGQDWGRMFYRDAMIHSLAKDIGLDMMAYQPAYTFINGKFWGIYNIREKINEWYIASNHNIDQNNMDMIERDTTILSGDAVDYNSMINFLFTNDISIPTNYEILKTQMDVRNYMDYMILECFIANSDWPWNNVKIWRQKNPHTKWKWILFDTDYGFNGGHLGPDADMFAEPRAQQNHTTFLFFKLLENPEYKKEFINRTADLLNTILSTDYTKQRINEFKLKIEPAMPKHIERWKNTFNEVWWLGKSIDTMQEWYDNIQVANNFANNRQDFLRQQYVNEFILKSGVGIINLEINNSTEGRIKINSLEISEFPWSGKYFIDNPITLTAIPNTGYRFVKWEGLDGNNGESVSIHFTHDQKIKAIFEMNINFSSSVVINEINYNSAANFDTKDWVEIYNNTDSTIVLNGWKFKDSNDEHVFELPSNSLLQSKNFLVMCEDTTAFKNYFPGVRNSCGNFNFGLSSQGELLRVLNCNDVLIDSLTYNPKLSWLTEADGSGKTISLKNPNLQNSDLQNWAVSIGTGTPGKINDVYASTKESDVRGNLPLEFALFQNYPNPFNPETIINYQLPFSSWVKLKIFDVLGNEVTTLVDEDKPVGVYTYQFLISNSGKQNQLSSGVYFYLLEARQTNGSTFRSVKKMVVLK